MKINSLVLRAPGTNCHQETAEAIRRAGGEAEIWPLQKLLDDPSKLLDFQFFVLPGGFSYGDDISGGKVFGNALLYLLQEWIDKLRQRGGLILGICNGFQVLIKCGLLPFPDEDTQRVTLTDNDSARFECRWVSLDIDSGSPCIFTQGLEGKLDVPVAHGEGKVFWTDEKTGQSLIEKNLAVFKYHVPESAGEVFPHNPNGSLKDVAGLCDPSGQILGLMPHPERHQFPWQHPAWTSADESPRIQGLDIFKKAVQALRKA
jgi:phosphoribosylformylglycinamidine synthase